MSIRKTRFSTTLMWAMVPLTVFGSLPRMGCICANGQHKFFCERQRDRDVDGRCACCFGQAAASSSAAKAMHGRRNFMACCRRNQGGCVGEVTVAGSDRPCRPVLDRVVFLASGKSSFDFDRAQALPPFAAAALELRSAIVPSIASDFGRGELTPPRDLVITLGVMLI